MPRGWRPDWPQGWTRGSFGDWARSVLLLAFAGPCIAIGLALLVTATGPGSAEFRAGAGISAFGLACIGVLPAYCPGPRRGHPRIRALRLGAGIEDGAGFPFSRLRTAGIAVAAALMALAALSFSVFPEATVAMRVVGIVGFCFFGLTFGYLVGVRAVFRRWWIVLTPSNVAFLRGRGHTIIPWSAVDGVLAHEMTVRMVRMPFIGIVVNDRHRVQTERFGHTWMRINRFFGADVEIPVRALGVDPAHVYRALTYYHRHREMRGELGTEAALARVRAMAGPPTLPGDG